MRFDLSDDEWAVLEPLIPNSRKSARADDRKIMNAIFYVLRTGDAVARSAGALWAVHDGVQSLQSLVSTRHLEADFRHAGTQIARQSVSDRQHHRESPSRGQRG